MMVLRSMGRYMGHMDASTIARPPLDRHGAARRDPPEELTTDSVARLTRPLVVVYSPEAWLSSLCGRVTYPPHPTHQGLGLSPPFLAGVLCYPLHLSLPEQRRRLTFALGAVAPLGATRLEWCPPSAFSACRVLSGRFKCCALRSPLRAPPRPPSVNVRGAALRARFDSARLGASRVLRCTEFI